MELTKFNKDQKNRRKPALDLSTMVYGKIPPQAKEIEEAVLGGCMLSPAALDIAVEILTPEAFYVDAHQRIFKCFLHLLNKHLPVDVLTVVEGLKALNELDMVGGPYAITKLTKIVSSTANTETHCRIVLQKFIQRELIRISGETIGEAYEDSADAFELMDEHETKLLTLTQGYTKTDFKTSEMVAVAAMERIDHLREHTDEISGVPTGFPYLDRVTNGWQPTDLIILAARPSVGKTAFALNLARNAATSKIKPTPVAFFSLEMSSGQLANRILAAESQVFLEKISRGRLEDDDYEKVFKANVRFGEMPIFIDDTASLTIIEFRSKARRLVSKHQVGLIIIDYLQLMSGVGKGNREQEISNISRNLKVLAKELHVPIIALSQMSRAIEMRSDKKGDPQLSDLRESGAIEQDADMVMFLYRPDYQQLSDEGDESVKGDAFGKIAKHRNGDLVKMLFKTNLAIQTFFDVDQYNEFTGNTRKQPAPSGNWKKIEPEQEQIPIGKGMKFKPEELDYTDIPPSDNIDDLPF